MLGQMFPRREVIWLLLLFHVIWLNVARSDETTGGELDHNGTNSTDQVENVIEEEEAGYAVLFPPFTLAIGVVVFYVLSRYIKALPYTAVMFLIGILMGITSTLSDRTTALSHTLDSWISIDAEVLLLVFLPGLIFKDAFGQNVHLFLYSLGQLLIFAFPMVLGGTVLGALIGYYIFPFGWSFNLAMTVGSILAATDPVAVAALLDEVGAPPRLKTHVAGESLLNDGSAIVFFSIFSARYYHEFGIDGFGEDVDVKKGIGMFCQKALGGTAVGFFFAGLLLACLYLLNRRFSREENVVQVATIFGVAYLNYFVADFLWETSGVIATVSAGITVRLIGRAMVNDLKLLEDFLTTVEHILNTILFALGGAIWGAVIAEGEAGGLWGAREWGYLILLYVLLHVIRAIQFIVAYPITVRIGLKTNWQETAFQIYGGLRGAVGIALAIALDNKVAFVTGGENETIDEIHTQQAFAMVGGVAFLTLVINGTTAGPLLRKLGLADSTEARKRIVSAYKFRLRSSLIDVMVKLLCQNRFREVNFALVKNHVPPLADLTKTQLLQAVEKYKATMPAEDYTPPYLLHVLPYLPDDNDNTIASIEDTQDTQEQLIKDHEKAERNARIALRTKLRLRRRSRRTSASNLHYMMNDYVLSAQELRILFISILRAAYDTQIEQGELDDAHLLSVMLTQSLEIALDAVSSGKPLKDWETLYFIQQPFTRFASTFKDMRVTQEILDKSISILPKRGRLNMKGRTSNMLIERSISFMAAHKAAQAAFSLELQDADSELNEAAKIVLQESNTQYNLAEMALKEFDEKTTELAISHKFCKILLTMSIHNVEKLVTIGLLKESEAEHFVEEIEEHLDHVVSCDLAVHPGEHENENDRFKYVDQEPTSGSDLHFHPGVSTFRLGAIDEPAGVSDDEPLAQEAPADSSGSLERQEEAT